MIPGEPQIIAIKPVPRGVKVTVGDVAGARPYVVRRRADGSLGVYPGARGDSPSRELQRSLAQHPAVRAALGV